MSRSKLGKDDSLKDTIGSSNLGTENTSMQDENRTHQQKYSRLLQ